MLHVLRISLDFLRLTKVLFLAGRPAAFGADESGLVDERSVGVEIFFEQFVHVAE